MICLDTLRAFGSQLFGNDKSDHLVVVVLQGDQAFWFKWQDHQLVDTYVEPVEAEALSKHVRCPWVPKDSGEPQLDVQLVLDTSLDELDRVKAQSLSGSWMQVLQRYRLRRRVCEEYPLASVHSLPPSLLPDALSIVHHVIPACWEKWLVQLQTHDVCISHVVTGLELLCHWSAHTLRQAVRSSIDEPAQSPGPVLISVVVGAEERHLLVDDGVPLFMRLAATVNDEQADRESKPTSLADTLRYVSEHVLRQNAAPAVVRPVLPWSSPSAEFSATRVLAALCIGHRVSAEVLCDASGTTSSGNVINWSQWLSQLIRQVRKRNIFPPASWRLSARHPLFSAAMQMSVDSNRLKRRIALLQKATILCALMAMITAVLAAAHGMASARERARVAGEGRVLGQQISRMSEAVVRLEPAPAFVTTSVERIDSHKRIRAWDPEAVLVLVAEVITDYPALALNSLSWSVLGENSPVDTAFTSTEHVNAREQLWDADTARNRIQVQLAGTVSDGEGLRAQQRVLEAFVDTLESTPGVDVVSVLESPLSAARSSDRLSGNTSGYRLALLLVAS